MARKKRTPEEQTIDPAAQEMLIYADELGISTAFTRADNFEYRKRYGRTEWPPSIRFKPVT